MTLKEYRLVSKLTLQQMADFLGIKLPTYWKLENGNYFSKRNTEKWQNIFYNKTGLYFDIDYNISIIDLKRELDELRAENKSLKIRLLKIQQCLSEISKQCNSLGVLLSQIDIYKLELPKKSRTYKKKLEIDFKGDKIYE